MFSKCNRFILAELLITVESVSSVTRIFILCACEDFGFSLLLVSGCNIAHSGGLSRINNILDQDPI